MEQTPKPDAGRATPAPGSLSPPGRGVVPVPGARPGQPMPPAPRRPERRSWSGVAWTVATVLVVVGTLGVGTKIIMGGRGGSSPVAAISDTHRASISPGHSMTAGPSGTATPSASASAAVATSADPSGAAMPVGNLPGWRQTFADDFTGALTRKWGVYDGQPGGDPGGWFDPKHVSVSGGLLTIGAWKANSPNGNLYVSGGVSNAPTFSQTYGLFKVRFKMDKGYGIAYTLQLWPTNDQWPPEIDIVEDNGKDRKMTSATLHYGTTDTHAHKEITGDWTGWHTAELEWREDTLIYRLDGNTWWTYQSSKNVPKLPMSIALQTQAWRCGLNLWEGCVNSSTPKRVDLQIDWVVAYQAMD